MTSREIDRAGSQLERLRQQRHARLLLSAPAAGLAAGALLLSDALAISLACGGAGLLILALGDTPPRRELLAPLALKPSAYTLPEGRPSWGRPGTVRGRRRAAAA